MNTTTRNILLGLAGSAILISAVALTTPNRMMPYGYDANSPRQKIHNKMPNNMSTWGNFAECLNLNQATVDSYLNKGYSLRDIHHAAFLAKASGKTLDEVITLKTAATTWPEIEKNLNITPEQLKATANELSSTRLTTAFNLDKTTVDNLLANGYLPKDISVAGILATKTNKNINEVLNLKAINNTWFDIALQLGIDKTAFENILAENADKLPPMDGRGMLSDHGMMKNTPHHMGKGNNNPPRDPANCPMNN